MRIARRLLIVPLMMAASAASAMGEVRDQAGLFSPEAVRKADADLARIGRETGVPVTIETIRSLDGRSIDEALIAAGKAEGVKGLLVLIAAKEHKIQAGASKQYDPYFNRPRYESIYESFMPSFRRNDFDGGLAAGVVKIDDTLQAVKREHAAAVAAPGRQPVHNPNHGPAPMPGRARPGFNIMTLVWIVLLVVGVMFVLRLLGGLFSAGRGGYGPGGGPGYGPGGMRGPGYGGPGYGGPGGGGGGFLSSLFGGIGGAVAGNYLYDQFGRRHDEPGYVPPAAEPGIAPTDAGNDWGTTAGDGGGDWGGGDTGGGGGGGDWGGGGGGDWGGGGGGGDWGGGGGDGGSW